MSTLNASMKQIVALCGLLAFAQVAGAASSGMPLVAREGTLLLNGGTHTVTGEPVIGGFVADGGSGQALRLSRFEM